jgi:hypothetical protein
MRSRSRSLTGAINHAKNMNLKAADVTSIINSHISMLHCSVYAFLNKPENFEKNLETLLRDVEFFKKNIKHKQENAK